MLRIIFNQKNIGIVILLIIFSFVIGWLLSPYLINSYFDRQSILTIDSTKFDDANINKVIILQGDINVVNDKYFTLMERINNKTVDGKIIEVHYTNLLNCKPFEGMHDKKIAGAWNPSKQKFDFASSQSLEKFMWLKNDFYAVWIVGGCE